MDIENQIPKGTKLITYQKAMIKNLEQRLNSQKYNIKNTKQNLSQKFLKIYREFVFFNRSFLNGNNRPYK